MVYRITKDCTGCGMCIEACVVQAIPETGALPFVIDDAACVLCGECEAICPMGAVERVSAPAATAERATG